MEKNGGTTEIASNSLSAMVEEYRQKIENIIYDDSLSEKEKISRINQVNQIHFESSGLKNQLKLSIDNSSTIDIKITKILSIFFSWTYSVMGSVTSVVEDIEGKILSDFEHESLSISLKEAIGEEHLSLLFVNILISLRDFLQKDEMDQNSEEDDSNNLWLALLKQIENDVRDRVNNLVTENVKVRFLYLLNEKIDKVDRSSQNKSEFINNIMKVAILSAYSEYLYATFLVLNDAYTSEKISKAFLEVFRSYKVPLTEESIPFIQKPFKDFLRFDHEGNFVNDKEVFVTNQLMSLICDIMAT